MGNLLWFSMLVVLVTVSLLFSHMYQDDIITCRNVSVTKWSPFGKGADLVNILFVVYLFAILVLFHFGFEGRNLVLIEPVPGHLELCLYRLRVYLHRHAQKLGITVKWSL